MRAALAFTPKPRTPSTLLSSHRLRYRQNLYVHELQARRSMSRGQTKAEANGHTGPEAEKSRSRRSNAGRGFFLSLAGFWAAATGCLSKAAVSLEGNLDRELCNCVAVRVHANADPTKGDWISRGNCGDTRRPPRHPRSLESSAMISHTLQGEFYRAYTPSIAGHGRESLVLARSSLEVVSERAILVHVPEK